MSLFCLDKIELWPATAALYMLQNILPAVELEGFLKELVRTVTVLRMTDPIFYLQYKKD